MDLSIVLSIVAIVVSVIMSGITLLLTQFQGPDISLINSPEFEVSDDSTETRLKELMKQGYTLTWLGLTATPFVFANHGGKSGTILSINCKFAPTEQFKRFFSNFYWDFGFSGEQISSSTTTIKEGDNKTLVISSSLHLINWKRAALAEVLESTVSVDDLITMALQRSKDDFEKFCNFFGKSRTFGTINCTISFTKGRFRTKVATESLISDTPLHNRCDHAILDLKQFLRSWENEEPRRTELLNEMKGDLEGITRELKDNLINLSKEVYEQNISASRLRVDAWQRLCNVSEPCERKIRWFLIRSEGDLEQELMELYRDIGRYNDLIDGLLARGEFRTLKHLKVVNEERSKLNSKVQTTVQKMSGLCLRHIP